MKKIFFTLLFSLTFIHSQSQESIHTGETEPESIFNVNINGVIYHLSENDELKLDTILSKPIISISLSDYKIFKSPFISFEYPQHLSYEFEQNDGYKNWTFSGNNLVILIFEIDAETTLMSLIDEMVKKFGKKNCTTEDFQKELGQKMLKGKKLYITLAEQNLLIECFEIKLNDSKSRFSYFQDIFDENKHTQEYESGLSLITSTLLFK
ncbi:MAG: hypothetical protein IPJ86_06585 [Bacteroidetes bacterium]|nr:hypothetical protein [Bacteroidota bacterium]